MATEEGLKIRIGATLDALKADINQAKAAISGLGKSVSDESSSVQSAGKSWNQLGRFILDVNYERRRMIQQINQGIGSWKLEAAAINEAAEAAKKATGQFVRVSGTIRELQNNQSAFSKAAREGSLAYHKLGVDVGFAGKATKDWIEAYRRTGSTAVATNQNLSKLATAFDRTRIKTTGAYGALSGFNNIIRDAPYGIIGIGNNITQLSDAFTVLKQQTGSTRAALAATIGSIFSPAGLFTVGLSSAITLWTIYSQRQQKAASEAKKAEGEIKSLSEIIKDGNINLQKYNASAAGEVAVLNRLFQVAADETRSRKERTSALKELKKETNGYLDSLTLETVKTDAARKSLDLFNASLFNNAILKANQSYVEELAQSYGKFARQGEEGKKRISELDSQIKKLNQPGALGLSGDERFEKVVALSKERNTLVLSTNKAINEQNRLQDEILATGTKIAELKIKVDPLSKIDGSSTKELKSTSTIIRDLTNDITGLNVAFAGVEGSISDLAIDKIKRYEKALKDLAEFGVRPGDELFNQIQSEIQRLQNSLSKTPVTIRIPINIEPLPSAGFNHEGFRKNIEEFDIKVLTPFEKKIGEDTNNAIRNGISNIASGLGSAVGELIAGGGDLQTAFGSIIGIFGGFIKQLGESMIAAGTAAAAAKILVKNPYTAIAAGIIAVAAGTAIQASLNKFPSFATGGTVTAPTLAMIGDNPGREEHIIPSEVLDKLSGAGGGFLAETRISGNDLLVLVKKAGINYNRING